MRLIEKQATAPAQHLLFRFDDRRQFRVGLKYVDTIITRYRQNAFI